jgi:hypothetical protein
MKNFAPGLAALLCFFACKKREFNEAETQSVLGRDDRVAITVKKDNLPPGYGDLVDAVRVFRFQDKTWANGGRFPFCTGFHVGDGIVVTAGHCFQGNNFENKPPLEELILKKSVIYSDFNYIVGGKPERSQIKKIIYSRMNYLSPEEEKLSLERNSLFDFAFVEISPIPKTKLKLRRGPRPHVGSKISIIGADKGRTLRWSGFCNIRDPRDPEFRTVKRSRLNHLCDLEPGSSGSPTILDETKEVIGITILEDQLDDKPKTENADPLDDKEVVSNASLYIDEALPYLKQEYQDRIFQSR